MEYIEEAAIKFGITNSKPISTPMESGFVSKIDDADKPFENNTMYRSLLGCLLYISRQTRPDILLSVNILSSYITNPMLKHWRAAKRILIYLGVGLLH